MVRCYYLECRQMMCDHHNMVCCALFDVFPNKVNTYLVHPVELLHLQQLPAKLNLTEVVHTFPYKILIIRIDMRPKCTQYKVRIIDADNLILIVTHILSQHPLPLKTVFHHIRIVIVFMITRNNQYLTVIFGCPLPEIHNWSSLILEIENISCQHQYITCYRQFIISQISAILLKFEMQITHILYSHFIILLPLIVLSVSLLSSLPVQMIPV